MEELVFGYLPILLSPWFPLGLLLIGLCFYFVQKSSKRSEKSTIVSLRGFTYINNSFFLASLVIWPLYLLFTEASNTPLYKTLVLWYPLIVLMSFGATWIARLYNKILLALLLSVAPLPFLGYIALFGF